MRRSFVGQARFHASLRAVKAIAQRPVFVGITELAQEATKVVRLPPGLFHPTQGGGECDSTGLRVLEHAALESAALPGPGRVEPARAICAQGHTWLAKLGHRDSRASDRNRQSQRLQLLRVVARSELDIVEERAVTAQPASETKLFTEVHAPSYAVGTPICSFLTLSRQSTQMQCVNLSLLRCSR